MAHWQSTMLRATVANHSSEGDRRATGLTQLQSAVADYAASACITGINWLYDENSRFNTQNIPIFGGRCRGADGAVFSDTDKVTLRRAGLVLRWLTIRGYTVFVFNPANPGQISMARLVFHGRVHMYTHTASHRSLSYGIVSYWRHSCLLGDILRENSRKVITLTRYLPWKCSIQ